MDMHSRERPAAKGPPVIGKLLTPPEQIYSGERTADGTGRVWVQQGSGGARAEFGHAPPCWGYGGREPAELALALRTDALGDPHLAREHQHAFKLKQVAHWGEVWSITGRRICEFVAAEMARDRPPPEPRFPAGQVVATPGVAHTVPRGELHAALGRHINGDWGDLDHADWNANEEALRNGGRLVSAYTSTGGERFWIITESDHTATTFLLPDEY